MILKNMICVAGFCLITLSGQAAGKPEVPPYKDKTVSIEKRVDDLMGRMTLREKVLQLQNRGAGRRPAIAKRHKQHRFHKFRGSVDRGNFPDDGRGTISP